MDGTKGPLTSLGIMGPAIALLVFVANQFWPGLGITDASGADVMNAVDTIAGFVLAIIGRAKATTTISLSGSTPSS